MANKDAFLSQVVLTRVPGCVYFSNQIVSKTLKHQARDYSADRLTCTRALKILLASCTSSNNRSVHSALASSSSRAIRQSVHVFTTPMMFGTKVPWSGKCFWSSVQIIGISSSTLTLSPTSWLSSERDFCTADFSFSHWSRTSKRSLSGLQSL